MQNSPSRHWRQMAEAADREWAAGRIDEAIRLFNDAVPGAEHEGDPVALGTLLHNLGLAFDQAGQGVQARLALTRAQELLSSDSAGGQYLGETLRLLGMTEVEAGELAAGLEHIEQSVRHFRERDDTDGATKALVDLGLALKDAERLTEASAQLSTALDAARRAELVSTAAHALVGLGLTEEKLERPDRAHAFYQEALAIYRQLADRGGEGTALYNLACLHDRAGELDEAARWFNEALDLDVRSGEERGAADCRASLASIQIELGNPAQARDLLLDALEFYRAGGYRRRACDVLIDLAAIARDEARFADAEAFLRQALALATELADPLELHDVRLHWGDLCFTAGDRAGARAQYSAAAAAIQQAREWLVSEQDAVSFFSTDRVECIDRLIVLTSQDDPRACVEWVERAKAQELIRRLAGIQLSPARDSPDELRATWLDAVERVRDLSSSLNRDTPASPEILSTYAQAQRQLSAAATALDEFDPEWAALRHGQTLPWDGIQSLLARLAAEDPGRGIVFVHYYLREDTIAVIGLRPGREPELTTAPVPLADLRAASAVPGGPWWAGTEQLLMPLVDPLAAWARPGDRILISAHDTLHRFALHAASIDGQPLGERNVVTYVPSATVLQHCISKRRSPAGRAVILGDGEPDQPLPFGRDQAAAIAALMTRCGLTVNCLLGPAATGTALADDPLLKDSDFVHFAVHGVAFAAAGLESGVRLADGILTARRFLDLRLRSSLVFLGACDTGVSERRAGDELLGLIRSTIYAGTASVMASLWPVDQLSSAMLVLAFYREHLAGNSKSDALQAAQRELRGATARDTLAYLAAARERAAGSPRVEAAVNLARARVLLFARDLPAAQRAVADVLAQPDLIAPDRREADQIGVIVRLGSRVFNQPDYSRCPFDHPRHWAPFILIGDTA